MTNLGIPCTKCGAIIQPPTTKRTGGLCMPCYTGNPRPQPRPPRMAYCHAFSNTPLQPVFLIPPVTLLEALENEIPRQPKRGFILEAYVPLIRCAIGLNEYVTIHNDFGLLGPIFRSLFEEGKAQMQVGDKIYNITDVTSEKWTEGAGLAASGGTRYRDAQGNIFANFVQWIS